MAIIRSYIAASLDGFIADRNGGIDWLTPFAELELGYADFIAGIGATVMGRRTYEQIISFGGPWPYARQTSLVVTGRALGDAPQNVQACIRELPPSPRICVPKKVPMCGSSAARCCNQHCWTGGRWTGLSCLSCRCCWAAGCRCSAGWSTSLRSACDQRRALLAASSNLTITLARRPAAAKNPRDRRAKLN